ncbi:MAG: hypothetical protein RIS94_1563 [Pseudomonadota bacterium]|jgi:hypothetical protein
MVVQVSADVQSDAAHQPAVVADISRHGCRVSGFGGRVTVGAPVTLRPAGLEAVTAWVRWTEGRDVGLEFARPLTAPAFDYLAQRHGVSVEFPGLAA